MGASQSTGSTTGPGNNNQPPGGSSPGAIVIQLQLDQLPAAISGAVPGLHLHMPGAPPGGSSGTATTSAGQGQGAADLAAAGGLPSPEWPPSPPPVTNESDEQYLRWCNRCKRQSYFREGICLNQWCSVPCLGCLCLHACMPYSSAFLMSSQDPNSGGKAEAPVFFMHGLGASVCSSCRYIRAELRGRCRSAPD